MKRLLVMATVAAVIVAGTWIGDSRSVLADEKGPDVEELMNDAAETLNEYGMSGFWRAEYFLSKVKKRDTQDLIAGLSDKDILFRMACAVRLLEMYTDDGSKHATRMMDKAEPLLLKIARDKDEDAPVRSLAVDVLARWGRMRNGKALLKIARDKDEDDSVRFAAAAAATALSEELGEDELKFMRGLLDSENSRLRFRVAVALYTMSASKSAPKIVRECRDRAANILQEYRREPSIEGLLANQILKNVELAVALGSMKGVKPEEVTDEMIDKLQAEYDNLFAKAETITSKVKGVRAFARQIAKKVKKQREKKPELPPDINMLWRVLVDSGKPDAKPESKPAEEKIERQFDAALEMVRGGDIDAFWDAWRKLVRLDRDASELLGAGMEEVGVLERIVSASAILAIYDKPADAAEKKLKADAQALLWKVIKDEQETSEVRHLATNALGRFGGPENSAQLLEYAKMAFDPFVRLSAIRGAYFMTGKMLGKNFLHEKLESNDLDVKAWAIITLCEMGDYESARNYFDDLKYEPTPRGRLIREYIKADRLTRKLALLYLGGPKLEHAAELKIEIEKTKREIEARSRELEEAAKMARDAIAGLQDEKERDQALDYVESMLKIPGEEEVPENSEAPEEGG
ncbi:MAG: hypothetical protein DRP79_08760 [Planctomycetota bacterium]|nr:MAG: hypothetical protein DRP79_08760 [Planctomycetota bacterium]